MADKLPSIGIEFTHDELRVLVNNLRLGLFNNDEDTATFIEINNRLKNAEREMQ